MMAPRGRAMAAYSVSFARAFFFIPSWIEIKHGQPYGVDMPGTITGGDNGAPHKVYGIKMLKPEGLAQVMLGNSIFVLSSTDKDGLRSNFPGRLVALFWKPLLVG